MNRRKLNKAQAEELERIRRENGGVLRPEDVLDAARSAANPLHDRFTWDDKDAAYRLRLLEAAEVIRLAVTVIGGRKDDLQVRTYVSLGTDRGEGAGGYRALVDVLSEPEARAQLLADALADLAILQQKYARLDELAGVWAAAKNIRRRKK